MNKTVYRPAYLDLSEANERTNVRTANIFSSDTKHFHRLIDCRIFVLKDFHSLITKRSPCCCWWMVDYLSASHIVLDVECMFVISHFRTFLFGSAPNKNCCDKCENRNGLRYQSGKIIDIALFHPAEAGLVASTSPINIHLSMLDIASDTSCNQENSDI